MMKKISVIVGLVLFIAMSLAAQQQKATLSFKELQFDFGKINESDGAVNHVFEFVNTGGAPLVLQNVESSCGCTTPQYSNKPVMPGAKGMVKAVFDPSGRPGSFTKEITVYSTAGNSPVVLRITGMVVPRVPTAADMYRFPVGDLRLKSSHLGFGKLSPGKEKTDTLGFLNAGNQDVKIGLVNVPPFLTVLTNPATVKPGKTGIILVTYNATKKGDWGFLIDYLYLSLNNKKDPNYRITITADISDDFSGMTPQQLADAPAISFENTEFNFGKAISGKSVEHDFRFTNNGKSDLKIRKIVSSCHCTTTNPADMTIKPGATSSIKAVFNTTGTKGQQVKAITVITNDPQRSSVVLWIKGNVE